MSIVDAQTSCVCAQQITSMTAWEKSGAATGTCSSEIAERVLAMSCSEIADDNADGGWWYRIKCAVLGSPDACTKFADWGGAFTVDDSAGFPTFATYGDWQEVRDP